MKTLPIAVLSSLLLSIAGCGLPAGLTRSRWAMADPEYAEKYSDGADKSDVVGKLKQASDARFVEDHSGYHASLGTSAWRTQEAAMGGVELGREHYLTSAWTLRGGCAAFANSDDLFTGGDVGTRLQSPSRLAPFVGAGTFVGYSEKNVPPTSADEESDTKISGALIAVYPETGVHFWWTPYVRLTAAGRYVVSSSGRKADDWLISGGLAIFAP